MTQMSEVREYLEHYGTKGMRWGVRKKRRGEPAADVKRHSGNRKKHVSELEDKELQSLVNRINMETQYSRLTKSPSKIKNGHNMVKGLLAAGVTANAVIAFATTPTGKALAKKFANTSDVLKDQKYNNQTALWKLKKMG